MDYYGSSKIFYENGFIYKGIFNILKWKKIIKKCYNNCIFNER